jgi:hypothetical protein
MRQAAAAVLGDAAVVPFGVTNMGGEDFAFYLERMQGCFMRVGAREEGGERLAAHSPRFTAAEESIFVGAAVLAESARSRQRRCATRAAEPNEPPASGPRRGARRRAAPAAARGSRDVRPAPAISTEYAPPSRSRRGGRRAPLVTHGPFSFLVILWIHDGGEARRVERGDLLAVPNESRGPNFRRRLRRRPGTSCT